MNGAWTLQLVYHEELRNAYQELRIIPPFCGPLRVAIMRSLRPVKLLNLRTGVE